MIEPGSVVAVLLAAGQSRRFGKDDKLLARLDGEPLVVHAARPLIELAPGALLAVCGNEHSAPARLLAAMGFEIVPNPLAESGLSTSLACGIARAEALAAPAALVCLADMPFVSLAHLRNLLRHFDEAKAPIVASGNGATASPPAVFARSMFAELRAGSGDSGARRLLRGAPMVEASAGELRDVDWPEQLR